MEIHSTTYKKDLIIFGLKIICFPIYLFNYLFLYLFNEMRLKLKKLIICIHKMRLDQLKKNYIKNR